MADLRLSIRLYAGFVALAAASVLLVVAATVAWSGESSARVDGSQNGWLWAGLAAAALALVLGGWTAHTVSKALGRVSRAASSVANGASVEVLRREAPRTLGGLSDALVRMADHQSRQLDLIRTERNKLQATIGGMVEGVLAVDQDERVLHLNETGARMLGISADSATHRPLREVTRLPILRDLLGRCLESQTLVRDEVDPNSYPLSRLLELTATPLRDGAGQSQGAVLVLHDVTELRRLERIRTDFVANVSHELKTPLAAIRGILETLNDDPEMPPDLRIGFLGRADLQAARLQAIIADLLALSRYEHRRSHDEAPVLDLRAGALDALKRFQDQLASHSLHLAHEVADGPIWIRAQEESLRQVMDNLLSNAIRYTPKQGNIALRVWLDDGYAVLEIKDDGIGIEPGDQDRIFERFYRADRARSRELGGTGLGLAIVKHAAESMNASVTVHSWPGKGSTFSVRIPTVRETERSHVA